MTTKPGSRNDFLHADQFELEELRQAVFEGSETLARPLALGLLARKTYPGKADDLSRLLMDDEESPRIRKMAARELARVNQPEAMEHLRKALSVRDPLVKQDVISALARVGGEEELKAVRRYRDRKTGDVARAAEWSSRLLTYITGSRGKGIDAPPRRTWRRADETRAEPVQVRATPGKRVDAALEGARVHLPSADLTSSGAVGLKCADRELILLFKSGLEKGNLGMLTAGRALAAVLTERYSLEDESWEVRFLVLTEPAEDHEDLRVLVCTPGGTVRFVGSLSLEGDSSGTFEIVGVDGPGAIPLLAQGVMEDGTIRFHQLVAEQRERPGRGLGMKKR